MKTNLWRLVSPLAVLMLSALLLACGGHVVGSGAATYTLGGTVSGLAGAGLVVQNNGASNRSIAGNGSFVFSSSLKKDATYSVSVSTQPSSPSQTCAVSNASGTVSNANVTNVSVTCTTNSYTIGGAVTGLDASGLVLQDNAGDDLSISADGSFIFATTVLSGSNYSVTIKDQPKSPVAQSCSVSNGGGTVSNAAVVNVTVSCRTLVGKFGYTVNPNSNAVSGYSINAATGALSEIAGSPFAAGESPFIVRADLAGKSLYVANRGSATVVTGLSKFSINSDTGALTQVVGSPFPFSTSQPLSLNSPIANVYLHPSGRFVYANTAKNIYGMSVNPQTGELTDIPGMPISPGTGAINAAMFDAQGKFFRVSFTGQNLGATPTGQLLTFQVDQNTGAATLISAVPTGGINPSFPAQSRNGGLLFVTSSTAGNLSVFGVDAISGIPTAVPGQIVSTGVDTVPLGAIVHPNNKIVYTANINYSITFSTTPPLSPIISYRPGSISAFKFDEVTGVLDPVVGAPFDSGGTAMTGPTIHPSGRFMFVSNVNSNNMQVFSVDATTGVLTPVPGSPFPTGINPGIARLDPSGRFLYCVNGGEKSISTYAIDSTTGVIVLTNNVATAQAPGPYLEIVGLQ
jgi:6-phosphogluconolactonase